jgi:ribosomal protein L11
VACRSLDEIKQAYDGASQRGDIVPVVITISEDRSFGLQLKTPPTPTAQARRPRSWPPRCAA